MAKTTMLFYAQDMGEGVTQVIVTPKSYWEQYRCVSDRPTNDRVRKVLHNLGFHESMESIYKGDMDLVTTVQTLINIPLFAINPDFSRFCAE